MITESSRLSWDPEKIEAGDPGSTFFVVLRVSWISPQEEEAQASVVSGRELLLDLDLADCDALEGVKEVYWVTPAGLRLVDLRGAWHKDDDPLYLAIADRETGATICSGWGTDH